MSQNFEENRFGLGTVVKGHEPYGKIGVRLKAQISTKSTATIYPATAVKLVSDSDIIGDTIVVDKAEPSDKVIGFVAQQKRNFTYGKEREVTFICNGGVMSMEAGGAIARGDALSIVSADDTVIKATSQSTENGLTALADGAKGDMIPVYIRAQP